MASDFIGYPFDFTQPSAGFLFLSVHEHVHRDDPFQKGSNFARVLSAAAAERVDRGSMLAVYNPFRADGLVLWLRHVHTRCGNF